jgi:hypothetical protein
MAVIVALHREESMADMGIVPTASQFILIFRPPSRRSHAAHGLIDNEKRSRVPSANHSTAEPVYTRVTCSPGGKRSCLEGLVNPGEVVIPMRGDS